MHDPHGQLDDDMITGLMSLDGMDNSTLDSNPTLMCYCPDNTCSCPLQRGLGQEQGHCLPPAAFQLKAPARILGSDPVLGDWNPDDFLMGEGLEMDEMNLNWDDGTFSHARP
jgi:hypothetical protein